VISALVALVLTQAPAESVAVVPVAATDEALLAAAAMRVAASSLGLRVRPSADVDRDLQAAASLGACIPLDLECAAQLGGLMGVDIVIVPKVDRGQLIVRATDVGQVKLKGLVQVPWAAHAPSEAANLAAVRLLRPDLERGTLVIAVDVAGANIIVDNQAQGSSPVAPLSLTPGRHEVYVAHVDFDSQTHVVNVPFAGTITVEVRLDPNNAKGRTTSSLPRPKTSDEGFRKVAVLPVLADGLRAHAGPLLTLGVVEALQRFDELIVAAPSEWRTLLRDEGVLAVESCATDSCLVEVFAKAGFDEIIVAIGEDGVLSARRLDVEAGVSVAEGQVVAVSDKSGQRLADELGRLSLQLYADRELRTGNELGISGDLRRRFRPAPLPVLVWGATAGGLAVGAATAAVGGIMLGGAGNQADAGVATAVLVAGAGVAALGLAAVVIEVPFVDWSGDVAANEELFATSSSGAALYQTR